MKTKNEALEKARAARRDGHNRVKTIDPQNIRTVSLIDLLSISSVRKSLQSAVKMKTRTRFFLLQQTVDFFAQQIYVSVYAELSCVHRVSLLGSPKTQVELSGARGAQGPSCYLRQPAGLMTRISCNFGVKNVPSEGQYARCIAMQSGCLLPRYLGLRSRNTGEVGKQDISKTETVLILTYRSLFQKRKDIFSFP